MNVQARIRGVVETVLCKRRGRGRHRSPQLSPQAAVAATLDLLLVVTCVRPFFGWDHCILDDEVVTQLLVQLNQALDESGTGVFSFRVQTDYFFGARRRQERRNIEDKSTNEDEESEEGVEMRTERTWVDIAPDLGHPAVIPSERLQRWQADQISYVRWARREADAVLFPFPRPAGIRESRDEEEEEEAGAIRRLTSCAMAGWLLDYPCVYTGVDPSSGKNSLAMEPLWWIRASASPRSNDETSCRVHPVVSFSVPQRCLDHSRAMEAKQSIAQVLGDRMQRSRGKEWDEESLVVQLEPVTLPMVLL